MSGNATATTGERTLSRVGRRAISIPDNVQVNLDYNQITVKGPKGVLIQPLHPEINVRMENGSILVERASSRKFHRSLHGLTRTLIANAIQGVSQGYQKTLQLMGVGYRVQQRGQGIVPQRGPQPPHRSGSPGGRSPHRGRQQPSPRFRLRQAKSGRSGRKNSEGPATQRLQGEGHPLFRRSPSPKARQGRRTKGLIPHDHGEFSTWNPRP